jgi:hypothetical protein
MPMWQKMILSINGVTEDTDFILIDDANQYLDFAFSLWDYRLWR